MPWAWAQTWCHHCETQNAVHCDRDEFVKHGLASASAAAPCASHGKSDAADSAADEDCSEADAGASTGSNRDTGVAGAGRLPDITACGML